MRKKEGIMNEMPLKELKEHIRAAQKWGSDLSGIWTDTLVSDHIDHEKTILSKAVQSEDWGTAYESMVELVQLCHEAEAKLEEESIHA